MPDTSTRTFPVNGCKHIHFSALGNIKLIQVGPDEIESVLAEGTTEALEHIKVGQEGSNLHIRLYTWLDFLFLPHPASYTIQVSETLDVHISGAGEILYQGSPQISQSITGSATIRKL